MTGFGPSFSGHIVALVNFGLTLVFVSFILRSKRPPGSTMAWLLFVAIIPYVGIPLFIFFSDRKFKTRLNSKISLYSPTAERKRNAEGDAVEKILLNFGMPPSRFDERAELLDSGEKAYAEIAKLIEQAHQEINITTFIFAGDPVGQSLMGLLEKKAAQGVTVRILLDSFGALWVRHPSFKKLKESGGQVAYFMKVIHSPFRGRTNLRNHRKILVVDSKKAIVGGMNLAQEYLGPTADPERWIDLCLLIEGASVQDVQNIFNEDWRFATGVDIGEKTRAALIKLQSTKSSSASAVNSTENEVQIVASGPDVKGDPLYDCLLTSIYEATRRVWIGTPYFIPDDSLIKALELAARRGLDVRLLTPKKSNHFLADMARGTYLRQLSSAGGRIGFTPKMLHAKVVIIDDDSALLGSANFDMRSLLLNYEIGVFVWSQKTISHIETWFKDAFATTEETNAKTGYWADLTEGLGRVLGPLI